jgi:predicted TIM-barrel fold metal-dependent hydrolase
LQRAPEMPLSETLRNMDEAGVVISLISAWGGPKGAMISNDEVAGFVKEAPDRLIGVGSVDISRPMEAVREIRRCKKVLFGTNCGP